MDTRREAKVPASTTRWRELLMVVAAAIVVVLVVATTSYTI